MQLSDLVARWVCGITASPVFTLASRPAWPLLEATCQYRRSITATNELFTGFMADGYSRATGMAGLIVSGGGPCITNLLTALGTARFDHSPLLVLLGQTATSSPPSAFQDSRVAAWNDVGVLRAMNIAAEVVTEPEGIELALSVAADTLGRSEPFVLAIPEDVARFDCRELPLRLAVLTRVSAESPSGRAPNQTATPVEVHPWSAEAGDQPVGYEQLIGTVVSSIHNRSHLFVDAGFARWSACSSSRFRDRVLHSGASAPMGWAVAAAIGAATAAPSNTRQFAIAGDGNALLAWL